MTPWNALAGGGLAALICAGLLPAFAPRPSECVFLGPPARPAGAATLALVLGAVLVLFADLRPLTAGGIAGALTLAAATDARFRLVPDLASLTIAGLALFSLGVEGQGSRIFFSLLLGLSLLGLQTSHRRLRAEDGIGLGDIKLASALSLWLSPVAAAAMLAAAVGGAALYSRIQRDDGAPLATLLAPVFTAILILEHGGMAP